MKEKKQNKKKALLIFDLIKLITEWQEVKIMCLGGRYIFFDD